jgi:hypothetical protein
MKRLALVLMMIGLLAVPAAWGLVDSDNHLLGVLHEKEFTVIPALSSVHARKTGIPPLQIRDLDRTHYAVSSSLNTMLYSGTHVRGLEAFVRANQGKHGFQMEVELNGRWITCRWNMPIGRDMQHYRRQLDDWQERIEALNAEVNGAMDVRGPDPRVPGPVEGRNWTSPATGMEFVWIPQMKIWVGKYEVTNGEYRRKEPSYSSGTTGRSTLGPEPISLDGDRQPAGDCSFSCAKAFAAWLTLWDRAVLEGLIYRLPSVREFQAFSQCGDGRKYPWGNDWPPKSGQAGNYADKSAIRARMAHKAIPGYDDGHAVSAPVEKSWRNPWGLYGVGGNVNEQCSSDESGQEFGGVVDQNWAHTYGEERYRCTHVNTHYESSGRHGSGFRLVLDRSGPKPPLTIRIDAGGVAPDGGDPQAVEWEVVNSRWVKNIYANGHITMSDRTNRKMWPYHACATPLLSWSEAQRYCKDLNYAGHSDWRLPDKDSLAEQSKSLELFTGTRKANMGSVRGFYSNEKPTGSDDKYRLSVEFGVEPYRLVPIYAALVWPMRRY